MADVCFFNFFFPMVHLFFDFFQELFPLLNGWAEGPFNLQKLHFL